jgi:hypothetical protein
MDLTNRQIIGWAVSSRMTRQLVNEEPINIIVEYFFTSNSSGGNMVTLYFQNAK